MFSSLTASVQASCEASSKASYTVSLGSATSVRKTYHKNRGVTAVPPANVSKTNVSNILSSKTLVHCYQIGVLFRTVALLLTILLRERTACKHTKTHCVSGQDFRQLEHMFHDSKCKCAERTGLWRDSCRVANMGSCPRASRTHPVPHGEHV